MIRKSMLGIGISVQKIENQFFVENPKDLQLKHNHINIVFTSLLQ